MDCNPGPTERSCSESPAALITHPTQNGLQPPLNLTLSNHEKIKQPTYFKMDCNNNKSLCSFPENIVTLVTLQINGLQHLLIYLHCFAFLIVKDASSRIGDIIAGGKPGSGAGIDDTLTTHEVNGLKPLSPRYVIHQSSSH
jgi:hypothetical protein